MTNKTPPAWVENAASEIMHNFDLSDASLLDEVVLSITKRAPDAEALAVALESLIVHAIEHHVISPVDESVAVIAAYRARFPKVTGE